MGVDLEIHSMSGVDDLCSVVDANGLVLEEELWRLRILLSRKPTGPLPRPARHPSYWPHPAVMDQVEGHHPAAFHYDSFGNFGWLSWFLTRHLPMPLGGFVLFGETPLGNSQTFSHNSVERCREIAAALEQLRQGNTITPEDFRDFESERGTRKSRSWFEDAYRFHLTQLTEFYQQVSDGSLETITAVR